jgi:hypothetical protein
MTLEPLVLPSRSPRDGRDGRLGRATPGMTAMVGVASL